MRHENPNFERSSSKCLGRVAAAVLLCSAFELWAAPVAVVNPDLIGQPLAIRLVNRNIVDALFPSSDLEVDFDNVRLLAVPVPVPSLLPWLALALGGLCAGARRPSS